MCLHFFSDVLHFLIFLSVRCLSPARGVDPHVTAGNARTVSTFPNLSVALKHGHFLSLGGHHTEATVLFHSFMNPPHFH